MLVQSFNNFINFFTGFLHHYIFPHMLYAVEKVSEPLLAWLDQYGSVALFVLLALGIVALPVPEDSLMFVAGVLIGQGRLQPIPTLIAAILGAWCGITVSYYLGVYVGPYLISTRMGSWLGLQGPGFIKAQQNFKKYGKFSLAIGYFIPVLRHFVGYIAGSLALPLNQFILYAYSGGVLWATSLISLRYLGSDTVTALFNKIVH